nr:inactive dipeptidyl peptidase 10-like isoform X5 [Zootoca vivipara]
MRGNRNPSSTLFNLGQSKLVCTNRGSFLSRLTQNMGFSSSPPRNWKGIGIAMLVVAMLASVIIVAILMLTPEEPPIGFRTPLTLDDLESDDFQLHQPQLHWVTDDELVELSDTGTMMKWHIGQKNSTLLVEDRDLHFLKASHFQVSPDLQFLLLACDVQQVFRYSFTARYLIYNLGTRETSNLDVPKADTAYLQYAAWGAKDNQLVFILDNDIYYQPGVSSRAKRITTSGRQAVVFNGIADWLYEEEILQTASAHWCSPDSMWLAYLSINNSLVPKMELPQFLGGKYPASQHYPYPKAGQPIPSVQLFVVNLSGVLHLLELLPPESFQGREYYITMVKWVGHSRLAVRWLNRPQNMSVLSLCEAATGACTEASYIPTSHQEIAICQSTDRQTDRETEGEFSSKCPCQSSSQTINDHSFSKGCQQGMPIFSEDAETLFLPVPVKQGPRGEFHHVTMLSTQPSRKESSVRLLTSGTWDVTRILAYDENSKRLYFLSSEDRLSSKHLYSVELDSSFNRTCVTCALRPGCSFVDVRFSPRMGNFILFCKGPGVPQVSVHRTANPRDFLLLEENRPLQDALMHKEMPLVEFRLYRLASYGEDTKPLTGSSLHGWDHKKNASGSRPKASPIYSHIFFLFPLQLRPVCACYPAAAAPVCLLSIAAAANPQEASWPLRNSTLIGTPSCLALWVLWWSSLMPGDLGTKDSSCCMRSAASWAPWMSRTM